MDRKTSLRIEALNAGLNHVLDLADSALGTVDEQNRKLEKCSDLIAELQERPRIPASIVSNIAVKLQLLNIGLEEGWRAIAETIDWTRLGIVVQMNRPPPPDPRMQEDGFHLEDGTVIPHDPRSPMYSDPETGLPTRVKPPHVEEVNAQSGAQLRGNNGLALLD